MKLSYEYAMEDLDGNIFTRMEIYLQWITYSFLYWFSKNQGWSGTSQNKLNWSDLIKPLVFWRTFSIAALPLLISSFAFLIRKYSPLDFVSYAQPLLVTFVKYLTNFPEVVVKVNFLHISQKLQMKTRFNNSNNKN